MQYKPQHVVNLNFNCKIHEPIYSQNEKKYLDLELLDPIVERIENIHINSNEYMNKHKLINPLEGNILRAKVPFRYKRATCKMSGRKLLHELEKGDSVNVNVEFCGVWQVGEHCGPSWKITMVHSY